MSTHDEDILQHRINAYEKRIVDLEEQLNKADAQIAAKEQEHQDFRLQNDAEWRAKLDHLKAQIAANEEERHKIVAALKAKGLGLYPVPDGEGSWHYEIKELDKDAWMTPPRNPNNG